jgi:hypothetical protein
MPSKRREFNDLQKAEIFARDRALCAYSGASLWLADFGSAPASIDWVDHIQAVSRGGASAIENGVCASFLYNWVKRDHDRSVLLFRAGRPTADYYTFFGAVRPDTAAHLVKFRNLHSSDWYANRTLFQVRKASAGISARRRDGEKFSRGVEYYSSAAMRFLDRWHRYSDGQPSLRARKLLPQRPSEDQLLLLSALEATTATQVKRIIKEFEPWLVSSWNAMEAIARVSTRTERAELAAEIKRHPFVARSVKRAAKLNLSLLDIPR